MLYAAFVSIVYVTGLFVVEPHILNHSESQVALLGNQTGSFMALVDGLGHTYMGLAVCMTAPVFAGGRLATWTRWIAIASGPAALMILAFYVAQRIPLGIPGDSPRPGLGRPGGDLLLQGWSSDVMAQTTAATQQIIAASGGAARRAAPKLKAWMGFWSGPPTSMSTAVMESEVEIKRRPAEVFDYYSDHTPRTDHQDEARREAHRPMVVGMRYEMEFIPGRPDLEVVEICTDGGSAPPRAYTRRHDRGDHQRPEA
jgi:hypothetical protein